MYDTLPPAYVHVFQTVIPRNRLSRMFSMNQARYSTLFSCVAFASLQFHRPQPLANSPSKTSQKPAMNVHHFTLKKSLHTPEVYRKIIHRNWKFTHKKNIRRKLIMTSTSSKLKYCVQKTTIQRDIALRIYYFAYMNSPPLFQVPSILRSCYSNYDLKR